MSGPPSEQAGADPLWARVQGELAPDFELVRPLGKGSVAAVYLAREVALHRLVAVKVLLPEASADEIVRRRFEREARSAASIAEPNVVDIYRVGAFEDGVPFLVMEYVEGRNLADALAAEGRMSADAARDALGQLAAALAAAHERGIIHRDLKPANVFREQKTGRLVLGDFGIAGILETGGPERTRLTRVGEVLGDFRYMSPEQMRGETLTAATDIYALGVLGYEILTGEGPYGAKKPAELASAHLRQPPLDLSSMRPDVDQAIADLLVRCLNKKPEHRPPAQDVVRALSADPDDPAAGDLGAPRSAFQSFIGEMGRRKVWRVGAAYVVGATLLLDAAANVFEGLPVPDWTYRAVVAVVLGLFPITLVLSWMFDLTSDGVRRTESRTESGGRGLLALQLTGLALSLGLAALIAMWVLRDRGA